MEIPWEGDGWLIEGCCGDCKDGILDAMESCVLNAVKTYVHVLASIQEHTYMYVVYCG